MAAVLINKNHKNRRNHDMTTHKFNLGKHGDLQALFYKSTLNMNAAIHQVRDLAAQLEAELYLARLFGDGIRPQ